MTLLLQSGLKNQDLTDNKRRFKMGRKRKVGRPKGSTKKRKKVVKKKGRRRLPPRVRTGKNKGRFKKRK